MDHAVRERDGLMRGPIPLDTSRVLEVSMEDLLIVDEREVVVSLVAKIGAESFWALNPR